MSATVLPIVDAQFIESFYGTTGTPDPDVAEVVTDEAKAAMLAQIDAEAALRGVVDGIKVIGYEVSWNVRDVQISRDDLKAMLDKHGFGGYLPARPPTAKKALRRAINEWASTRAGIDFNDGDDDETTQRRRLSRQIPATKGKPGEATPVIFGLVEESALGEALGLKYATSMRFRYRPATSDDEGKNEGVLTVVSSASGPIADDERSAVADQLRPIWEKHKTLYSGAEIGYIMIDIIHGLLGISVETGSGVWYVPAKWIARVDELQKLIRALPTRKGGRGTHCRVSEKIDWVRTKEALAEAALDDLQAEIARAENDLKIRETATRDSPGSVKITTVKGIMDRLGGLREKAIFYADTMGMRNSRLMEEMDVLGTRAVVVAQENRKARKERDLEKLAPSAGIVATTFATSPEVVLTSGPDAIVALVSWLYDVDNYNDAPVIGREGAIAPADDVVVLPTVERRATRYA